MTAVLDIDKILKYNDLEHKDELVDAKMVS